MTYRLYFWFKNVPEDRSGGPWWYRDFNNKLQMDMFLRDAMPFLYKAALLDGEILPAHNPMKIYPPQYAVDLVLK